MYSKMMLPIELTKILYSDWKGTISVSSQDSQIYGKCLNGQGQVTFKNGNRYIGQFHNGLLNGKGKFVWANGIVYEGQFTDNRITGKGIYEWPDGSIYEGEVKDGLRHGYGVYKIDDATYEGEWENGKKQGKGKIIFKSGSIFEGNFKNDLKHGYGKMYYYPSGNYFQGLWQNDLKQGKGTMNWTDLRQKYFGEWHKNYQHGWGVHIWLQSKGQGKFLRNRYQGNWGKGVREGFGTFYYANGSKYEGYWQNNMKQGYAFYTNENGRVSHMYFDKDRMLRSGQQPQFEENNKKVSSKKQVEPNTYSLCLQIQNIFCPFTPNLQALYNLLLRNNTQLKAWYKGLSNFYDQQSEYSFCLNLEGVWKMIRTLKVLGDVSLASLDRGLRENSPQIQKLLKMIDKHQENVDFEDIYYKNLASNIENLNDDQYQNPKIQNNEPIQTPFDQYIVHNRNKNILFREFVHLLVWIACSLIPSITKPQKSVQQILTKVTPMLQTISKSSVKMGTSDNISQNMSSVSKTQKSISVFFKTVNKQLMQTLANNKKERKIRHNDLTVRIRELLAVGIRSGVFDEPQFTLLQKILDKYMDPQILSRTRQESWSNSNISTKILNVNSYQLVQYEFIEIIYFLIIKKLSSHKQTEQNKAKYMVFLDKMKEQVPKIQQQRQKQQQFINQKRYLKSAKAKKRQILQKKRAQMEKEKKAQEEKANQLARQQMQRQMMQQEDKDIKDMDFQEEQSQLSI